MVNIGFPLCWLPSKSVDCHSHAKYSSTVTHQIEAVAILTKSQAIFVIMSSKTPSRLSKYQVHSQLVTRVTVSAGPL